MPEEPEWLKKARKEGRIQEGKPACIPLASSAGRTPATRNRVVGKRKPKTLAKRNYKLTITFGLKTQAGPNHREHWSARASRVKAEREATRDALHGFEEEVPLGLFRETLLVGLTRLGGGKMDDDNLQGSLKAVRDEIAKWVGADDGSDWYQWRYAQEPGNGPLGVRIEFSLARPQASE